MRKYRIKISEKDFNTLKTEVFTDSPLERGTFALAGLSTHNEEVDILVRRVLPIPQDKFDFQSEVRLEINSRAISGLGSLCSANGLTAVVCHSHPADSPYSSSDYYGESRIFGVLQGFIPETAPLVSLLFTPNYVDGRVWIPQKKAFFPVSEIVVVGRSIKKIPVGFHQAAINQEVPGIFDRQVRALGTEGQQIIQSSKAGIVGLGGTGTPVAEQLVRLGVQDLVIIDHDLFEPSNITRMYGSFPGGGKGFFSKILATRRSRHKVDIIKKHLLSINPELRILPIRKKVSAKEAGLTLLDRDMIFICTDDHWGRSVVNQISYQYLIPAINIGVRIDADNGAVTNAGGSLDIIRPDQPCLWCSGFLDAGRIASESYPKDQRQELLREGYVEDIDAPAPSVISFTSTMSGFAVSYFLQLITDFMGATGNIRSLRYNILTGEVRRVGAEINTECICSCNRGFGDLKPLSLVAE